MTDVSVKYQKLALEYAKLKAQNQVLKQAVIDANASSTQLQDNLQSRDQAVRRLEQEVDSCNFRNHQMVRRVELLQSELESIKISKHPNKTNSHVIRNSQSALDEDLQIKIKENEMLHKQVFEADTKVRQIKNELSEELDSAKNQIKLLTEELRTLKQTYEKDSSKLNEEGRSLRKQLEESTKSLKTSNAECLARLEEKTQENEHLKVVLEKYKKSLKSTGFGNIESTDYAPLKVLPFKRRNKIKLETMANQLATLLSDFFVSWSNFHKYLMQRCRLFPVDCNQHTISSANQMLAVHLNKYSDILKPTFQLKDAFKLPLHPVLLLPYFQFDFFSVFSRFFDKLFPYYFQSLTEECESCICAPSLQEKNNYFLQKAQLLLPAVKKLASYFHLINISHSIKISEDNVFGVISKLVTTFTELHLIFKEMSKTFNSKIALEYQLPTTTKSPDLLSANELFLAALLSLSNSCAALSGFLSENNGFPSLLLNNKDTSAVSYVKTRNQTADYMSSLIPSSPPPSVPYQVALHNEYAFSNQNKDNLFSQLKATASKLHDLEQEKEHWLLETQLLQMKFDKQVSDTTTDSSVQSSTGRRNRTISASITPTDTSMLGEVQIISNQSQMVQSSEELIKQHMAQRLSEAGQKIQAAEVKTIHFESECRSLHKHVSVLQSKKASQQQELDKSTQVMSRLNDELSVTRRNYEEQLSLMSEHLAAMNDKLAAQEDEINMFKTKKDAKKSRK